MAIVRAFADPDLTPDDFSNFSKQDITADSKQSGDAQQQQIPKPRNTTPIELSSAIGTPATAKIQSSGKIVFHTVGDTGGVHSPQFQFAVADAMAEDVANGVSFFYHLGDLVYYFGQDQYYFDQFYDPYRNYAAPIYAIPGNHDAVVFRGETEKSLDAFVGNFCTNGPQVSPDAQGAVRTTMDQPGVYFTLNAPFVKLIGLYSNTGEGGMAGVIASSKIGNAQLDFLNRQLVAAKKERDAGTQRALVIATHHPPFTGSAYHIPSADMLSMIDKACETAEIWPDLHLAGHSHMYERYTRTVAGREIPYLVAGMGGYYNLAGLKPGKKPPLPKAPQSGKDASGNPLTLESINDTDFGFMRMTVSATSITGEFITVDANTNRTGQVDSFMVNLASGTVTAGLKKVSAAKAVTAPAKKVAAKKGAAKGGKKP